MMLAHANLWWLTMCEEDIIRYCAPTLAGIKTGSLFACIFPSKSVLRDEVRCMNRRLLAKGLRVLPLSFKNNRALLYFFRPDMLKHSLSNSLACQLLAQRGYPCENPDRCIIRLMEQLKASPEFPHEIGLFLGYPPEDVQGFIEQRALNSKCTGCWKVYGNQKEAEQTFARYKKCTDCYLRNWQRGKSLEALTVSLSGKSRS